MDITCISFFFSNKKEEKNGKKTTKATNRQDSQARADMHIIGYFPTTKKVLHNREICLQKGPKTTTPQCPRKITRGEKAGKLQYCFLVDSKARKPMSEQKGKNPLWTPFFENFFTIPF